jgi:RNA polymerase sigma-70 factor (ECF subfamily)
MLSSAPPFPDDAELVPRLRAGDASAYELLYRLKYATLVDFAGSIVRHRDLAEEVVADVMVWVYEHRATLAPKTSLAAYLFTAVRRRALNVLRDMRRAAARHVEAAGLAALPASDPRLDDLLVHAEDAAAITMLANELLGRLGEPSRTIVLLRITQGLTHDEIADVMQMSADAVRAQFSRTIRALRQLAGPDPRRE